MTNKKTFLISLLAFFLLFVTSATLVSAQGDGGSNPGDDGGSNPINITISNPLACGENCTLFTFVEMIVNNIILPLGGVLCVLAFIYSGFKYVMARGDSKAIGEAHLALLYTAIGTALLLGAWLFANVIKETVNELII